MSAASWEGALEAAWVVDCDGCPAEAVPTCRKGAQHGKEGGVESTATSAPKCEARNFGELTGAWYT